MAEGTNVDNLLPAVVLGINGFDDQTYFLILLVGHNMILYHLMSLHVKGFLGTPIVTQFFDTWVFFPVQPGPAPARPCPALTRLMPSPALCAQATHGPAPARPGLARPGPALPGPALGRGQAPESPQLGVPKCPTLLFTMLLTGQIAANRHTVTPYFLNFDPKF